VRSKGRTRKKKSIGGRREEYSGERKKKKAFGDSLLRHVTKKQLSRSLRLWEVEHRGGLLGGKPGSGCEGIKRGERSNLELGGKKEERTPNAILRSAH